MFLLSPISELKKEENGGEKEAEKRKKMRS